MVNLINLKSALTVGAIVGAVSAHPGHDVRKEVAEKRQIFEAAGAPVQGHNLDHCYPQLKQLGIQKRALARREALIQKKRDLIALLKTNVDNSYQQQPNLTWYEDNYNNATDGAHFAKLLNTTHNITSGDISLESSEQSLFATNASTVLVPETIQGPYWVAGELFRKNVTEGHAGVPMALDVQLIDVETCLPATGVYIDIWHCNSTGVYSGVHAEGNGNYDDASNINSTFLRGVVATDENGVASFDTLFPGHYANRATHLHILTHTNLEYIYANGTYYANASYSGGRAQHTGQLFWDQDLISDINTNVWPYNTNNITIVPNADDLVLQYETENNANPFPDYVYLGDSVADGLLSWIAVGVNMSANYNITPNAEHFKDGSVMVNTKLHQDLDAWDASIAK